MRSLWASSHPGPTVVVTLLAVGLAAGAGVPAVRIVLLGAAVFAGQLSVGISNDAIDAARDRAVGRTDKPIAAGKVSTRTAWAAALTCLVLALALSTPLGWGLLAAHAVLLASAWSYNLGLKSTAFSLLPFLISFGLFPSLATLADPDPQIAAPWAWLAGAALGAAVHLTNVLPDLDDDAATGVRGMPHRIGLRASAGSAAATVLAGALAVTAGPHGWRFGEISALSWTFFALASLVVTVTIGLASAGRSGRVLFRLVMLAAALLAVQLMVTGDSLSG